MSCIWQSDSGHKICLKIGSVSHIKLEICIFLIFQSVLNLCSWKWNELPHTLNQTQRLESFRYNKTQSWVAQHVAYMSVCMYICPPIVTQKVYLKEGH